MGNSCCCCVPGWKRRLVITDSGNVSGCGGFVSGGGGCGGRFTQHRQVELGDYDSDDDPGCGGRKRRKNKKSSRGRRNQIKDRADVVNDVESDSDPGCGGRRNKSRTKKRTGQSAKSPRNNGEINTAYSDSDSDPGCGGRKKNKSSKKIPKPKKSPTNKVHAIDENPNAQSNNKRNPNGFIVHKDKLSNDTQHNSPRINHNKGLKDRTNIPNGVPSTDKQTFDNDKWSSKITHHEAPQNPKNDGVVLNQWKLDTGRYITQENQQENRPGNNKMDGEKWRSRTTHYPPPQNPQSETSGDYYKSDTGRYITQQEKHGQNESHSICSEKLDGNKWISRTTHYPPPQNPQSETTGAYYKPDTGRYIKKDQEILDMPNNMPPNRYNMTDDSLNRINLAKNSFSYNFDGRGGPANETQNVQQDNGSMNSSQKNNLNPTVNKSNKSDDDVPSNKSLATRDSKSAIEPTMPTSDIYNGQDAFPSQPKATIGSGQFIASPPQFGKHPSGKHFSPRESMANEDCVKVTNDMAEQENEALRKKIKELEEALVESQKDLCTQIILDRNMGDEFDSETVFGDLCHLSNIQKEITVIKHTQIGNSPTHVTIATNTEGHIGVSSADMSTGMDRPATTAMSTGTDGIGGTSIGTEIDEELSETDLQGKHNKEMQAINKDFSIKLRKRVDDMSQKDLKKLLDEHRRQVEKLQLQQQSERERLRRCLQERLNQRQNQNNKLSSDMSNASSSSSSSSDDSDSCVNQSKSSKKLTSQSDNYSDTSFCSSDSGSSSDSESENEENAELMNTVTSEIMTNISSMTEKDMKDYMQIARRQREKLKRIRGNEKQRADESLLAILARRREVTDKEGNVFDGDKEEMPVDDAGDNGDESGPPHDNAEASQTELFMKDAHTQMQEKINRLNEEINTQIDTSVKQMDEKFVQTLMEVQTNMDDEDNDSTEKAMKELLNRHLKQADELRDRKEEERNRQKENLMKILKAKKERMMEKNRKDGTSSNNNDTEPDNEVDSDAVFKEEVEKDPNVKLAKQELKQELEEMETDLFKELKFRQLDNNLDVSEMNELLERYRREQQRMRERKEAEMKRHKDNVLQKLKERQKQKEELDKQLYREIHEKQKTEQLTEADLKAIIDQHLKQTSRLEKIQESEKDRQSRKLQEKLNKKKIIDEEKERKKRERERLEMQAQEEAERRKFEEAELKNQKINDAVKVVKGYHETERQLKVNKRIEKERLEEKLRRKLDTGKKRPSNLPEVEDS